MLACNRLRVDLGDGYVVDYRIQDGRVESRIQETESQYCEIIDTRWESLTAAELSSHVLADTVVARWLSRRMGVERLLRACDPHTSFVENETQSWSDRPAA